MSRFRGNRRIRRLRPFGLNFHTPIEVERFDLQILYVFHHFLTSRLGNPGNPENLGNPELCSNLLDFETPIEAERFEARI